MDAKTSGLIAAVVVTYNRKELLLNCLTAMLNQTRRPDLIVIIDNASSDGTPGHLDAKGWLNNPIVRYVRLDENTGGAGGFYSGIKVAMEAGADRVWMMDDDALPRLDALHELLIHAERSNCVYGSVAVQDLTLCWPLTQVDSPRTLIKSVEALPAVAEVAFIPFLGFMVSRSVVENIGLPDAGFFLAADDVEYCLRAQRAGISVVAVSSSRIDHPLASLYSIRVPGRVLVGLRLAPWKRYYDTRNRLFIAKKYYGFGFYTKTIPGSFARLFAALLVEPRKWMQLLAFFAGFIDGILGRKGRRHERWGIRA